MPVKSADFFKRSNAISVPDPPVKYGWIILFSISILWYSSVHIGVRLFSSSLSRQSGFVERRCSPKRTLTLKSFYIYLLGLVFIYLVHHLQVWIDTVSRSQHEFSGNQRSSTMQFNLILLVILQYSHPKKYCKHIFLNKQLIKSNEPFYQGNSSKDAFNPFPSRILPLDVPQLVKLKASGSQQMYCFK